MAKKAKIAQLPPIIVFPTTVNEDLPFPYVDYPSHYGSFITFSELEDSQKTFLKMYIWTNRKSYSTASKKT